MILKYILIQIQKQAGVLHHLNFTSSIYLDDESKEYVATIPFYSIVNFFVVCFIAFIFYVSHFLNFLHVKYFPVHIHIETSEENKR